MAMSFNNLKIKLMFVLLLVFTGCSNWTEPEVNVYDDCPLDQINKDEAYYKALRAYKASEHSVAFGWFSGWGEGSANVSPMLSAVPDSVDIISLWDNYRNLSDAKKKDLEYVQKVKGTKVLRCSFIQYVGCGFTPSEYNQDEAEREAFWGWEDGNEEAIRASLAKYAKAINDTIAFYGYDGFDIDFEPFVDGYKGKLDENSTYVQWFLDELCKYLGPKSQSGKMLVIDGEITRIPVACITYFDYYISQAYSVSGGTPPPTAGTTAYNKDLRLSQFIDKYESELEPEVLTNKFIITENLESAMDCLNGGFFWTDIQNRKWNKNVMPSLVGFSSWQPYNGFRKGGFGGYKFNNEAVSNTPYKWLRKAIQQQNPAPGVKIITDDDYVAPNK